MMGQLVALIGRALQDDIDLKNGKRTLLHAITAAIEADLANPDLSVKRLCDRLSVSRSTLYEAVAAEGMTVAGMVLDRRLAQCLASSGAMIATAPSPPSANDVGFGTSPASVAPSAVASG